MHTQEGGTQDYMDLCECSLLFRQNSSRLNIFRLYSDPEVDPLQHSLTCMHVRTHAHHPFLFYLGVNAYVRMSGGPVSLVLPLFSAMDVRLINITV